MSAVWWWIYPFFFFAITLTAQYHHHSKEYWRGLFVAVGILNIALFFTNTLIAKGVLWWPYPVLGLTAIMLLIYYKRESHSVTTIGLVYLVMCLLFFVGWLQGGPAKGRGFPWFFIPVCLLAVPFGLYGLLSDQPSWLQLGFIWACLDIMSLLIWGFTITNFALPWFLIVWAVSIGMTAFFRWRNITFNFAKPMSLCVKETSLT
eukprot:TRINITY_DN8779_c0_g1_i1.p2 TRINITY_DN8779_c0_g1~~TRINITY_DN8779_c0_g1_i1.p2  ORF type:complete len:204 (-),score=2.00 TRINITY_DN8779_c0_g1_i1:121-732(-)